MDSDLSPRGSKAREELPAATDPAWGDLDLGAHEVELRAAARYICGNDSELGDLIQDTFERALRFLSRGNPRPTHMRPWLVSILRHAFIDRRRRTAVAFEPIGDEPSAIEQEPQPPWGDVSIEQVRVAVRQIEPDLGVLFELHYFSQLRYKDIAQQLGIPQNTVATRLSRARKVLREILMRGRVDQRSPQ